MAEPKTAKPEEPKGKLNTEEVLREGRAFIKDLDRRRSQGQGPSLQQLEEESDRAQRDLAHIRESYARGMTKIAARERADAQEMARELARPLDDEGPAETGIWDAARQRERGAANALHSEVWNLFVALNKAYDKDVKDGVMTRAVADEGIAESRRLQQGLFSWVIAQKQAGNYAAVMPKLNEFKAWLQEQIAA
jgi:hypothetical protein